MMTGCLGGSQQPDNGESSVNLMDNVPSDANAVGVVDGGIMTDENTKEIVESLRTDTSVSYQEMLSNSSQFGGLNVTHVNKVLFYGVQEQVQNQTQTNGSVLLHAPEWNMTQLSNSIEETENYQEESTSSYSGLDIIVYSNELNENVYFTELESGLFMMSESMREAEDVIDVHQGNGDAISGELRQNIEDMSDKYIRFSAANAEYEQSVSEYSFDSVSGSFDYVDENMVANFEMDFASSQNATRFNQTIGFLTQGLSQENGTNITQNLDITRNEDTVSISFEEEVEDVISYIEERQEVSPQPSR
jgi:hypothetical protein